MTRYLTSEDLAYLVERLDVGPVRDVGLLESAAARPSTYMFGLDPYPTLELKAAALIHAIVRNHPLVDGNKRLAFASAVVFLSINERGLELSEEEAFELIMDATGGDLSVEEIAANLRTT